MPEPTSPPIAKRQKHGGPRFHKDGCQCPTCIGRTKAGLEPIRKQALQAAPTPLVKPEDILYADEPKSHRNRIIRFIELRGMGLNNIAIAERMGISPRTLNTAIWRAAKEGWLKFIDPVERFNQEILPKVVDNIDYFIDKRDKTMTIEAAKGGGVFKNYQAIKVESSTPQSVLAIKIETIAPEKVKEISVGHIVGKAKEITEGEVLEDTNAVE